MGAIHAPSLDVAKWFFFDFEGTSGINLPPGY
jgi:hypothetical protein